MSYELADHLVSPRIGYTHHGLFAGGDEVLEYSRNGVNLVSMESFSEDYPVSVETHLVRRYSREESVQRGISRLGEDEYNVIFNNCERFVNWCINGLPVSSQVEGIFLLRAMELAAQNYINKHILPQNAVELLIKNPIIAQKLISIFGENKLIFNILGPAMSSANIPLTATLISPIAGTVASTISASTATGVIGGTVAGIGTGIAAGSAITTGAATTAGLIAGGAATSAAIVAAPIAAGVGAAVAVGYGIKKIFDFFSD